VKFGSTRDNDEDCNIRYGQLKMTGTDVASFFEPSVECIIDSVQEQRNKAHKKFTHVVLVGGFAASDWLFKKVSEALKEKGFTVVRPDHHVNKAVADGAISYYIDHFVQTRVSKLTYGSKGSIDYDASDAEHQKRVTFTAISGVKRIDRVFWVILSGNKQVPETNEIRRSHYWEFTSQAGLYSAKSHIYCYRGIVSDAAFMDINPDLYSELCTIEVDLSHLWNTSSVQILPKGSGVYYKVSYELVMLFGGTEIEAQLCWKENGIEKRSSAKVLYTDSLPKDPDEPVSTRPAVVPSSQTTASTGASMPGATLSANDVTRTNNSNTTTTTTPPTTPPTALSDALRPPISSKKSKTDDKCVHQ